MTSINSLLSILKPLLSSSTTSSPAPQSNAPVDLFESNPVNPLQNTPFANTQMDSKGKEKLIDALEQLYSNFSMLQDHDGSISRKNLLGVMMGGSEGKFLNKPELSNACSFLYSHPDLKQFGWEDTITKADLRGVLQALYAPPTPTASPADVTSTEEVTQAEQKPYALQWANAVSQLSKHFELVDTAGLGEKGGVKNYYITKDDLQATLNNPGLPAELHEACRFFLDNPEAFDQLATADRYSGGGIHWSNMASAAEGVRTMLPPATQESAYDKQLKNVLTQIAQNFDQLDTTLGRSGEKTGYIGHKELEAAANNPGLPAELREACQFLLDNPAVINLINSSRGMVMPYVNGSFNKTTVETMLAASTQYAQTPTHELEVELAQLTLRGYKTAGDMKVANNIRNELEQRRISASLQAETN